jgi:hypothetical protein
LPVERSRIDEEGGAHVGEARGHLIHDPDWRADEVGLRRATDLRERDIVELELECGP